MRELKLDSQLFNALYNDLKARRDKLRNQLDEAEMRVTAFEMVMEVYAERANGSGRVTRIGNTSRAILQKALVELARRQDGVINVYEDKEKLVAAGAVKGEPRVISYRVGDALRSSERFERMEERGHWRLVDF